MPIKGSGLPREQTSVSSDLPDSFPRNLAGQLAFQCRIGQECPKSSRTRFLRESWSIELAPSQQKQIILAEPLNINAAVRR